MPWDPDMWWFLMGMLKGSCQRPAFIFFPFSKNLILFEVRPDDFKNYDKNRCDRAFCN